jgi:hypothetical protein
VSAQSPDLSGEYFAAVASGGDDRISAVAEASSSAATYLSYLDAANVLLGRTAAGSMTASGSGFTVCRGSACTSYDHVVTDETSGRVVSFSVDGRPLAGRISGEGFDADVDDVHARSKAAYLSNEGQLLVLVELSNSSAVSVEVFGFAAVFQADAATGGAEAAGAWGAMTVEPGAVQPILLAFPGTGPAGRLSFAGVREDGVDVSFDVAVPAPL